MLIPIITERENARENTINLFIFLILKNIGIAPIIVEIPARKDIIKAINITIKLYSFPLISMNVLACFNHNNSGRYKLSWITDLKIELMLKILTNLEIIAEIRLKLVTIIVIQTVIQIIKRTFCPLIMPISF